MLNSTPSVEAKVELELFTLMAASAVQPLKARSPRVVRAALMVKLVIPVQFPNASFPTEVVEAGSENEVNPGQSKKADWPIFVMPAGKLIEPSDRHSRKA